MAVDKREELIPLIKSSILVSIRTIYNFIHDYPYPFFVCIFLIILYKIFPSLFFLILHSSPVFFITSLILAALLSYGEKQTKSNETYSGNNNSRINTELSDPESDEKSESPLYEKKICEKERFRRLTSLIERRRARMSIRHEIKRNLIDPENGEEALINDSSDFFEANNVSPVNIPRWDPFSDQNEGFFGEVVPSSAPSILHHKRGTPFEEFLPGATRFSRLDPFLVTEMDLVERKHAHGVQLKNGEKEFDLKNTWSIRGHGSGNGLLESKGVVIKPEIEKDAISKAELPLTGEEGDAVNSYSDTILLSEFLNLCSFGISPPTKERKIEPREEKVNKAPDDTCNGVSDTSSLELETVKIEENSKKNDEKFKPKEETVKIKENGENGENKSIEIVKVEPISNGVLELKHKATSGSVSHETGRVVLSEPEGVKQSGSEDEKSGSVICETGQAPDGLLTNGSVICEMGRAPDGLLTNGSVSHETGRMVLSEPEVVKQSGSADEKSGSVICETGQAPDCLLTNGSVSHETDRIVLSEPEVVKQSGLVICETGQAPDGLLTNGSVSHETGWMVLSEPEVVKQSGSEDEKNGSVICETGEAPDDVLKRSPLSSSIASDLKKLRKQNKHGESSSSSFNDSD